MKTFHYRLAWGDPWIEISLPEFERMIDGRTFEVEYRSWGFLFTSDGLHIQSSFL